MSRSTQPSLAGWGTVEGTNPDSVKSQTGYIIEIANCPVLWVPKLQQTIPTSTVESEYTPQYQWFYVLRQSTACCRLLRHKKTELPQI